MDNETVPDRNLNQHHWLLTEIQPCPGFVIELQSQPNRVGCLCSGCYGQISGCGYRACVWLKLPTEKLDRKSPSPFDAWRI